MPLLSFDKQFAYKVYASINIAYYKSSQTLPKRHTIRIKRRRPIKPGDKLFLWCCSRSKNRWKIGESICQQVKDITITEEYISIEGKRISENRAKKLAIDDGFKDLKSFYNYFKNNCELPFTGELIVWQTSYDRKYYLHRQLKELGVEVEHNENSHIMLIKQENTALAENKYVKELQDYFQYGIQLTL